MQSVSGGKTIVFYFQYTFGDIISFPRKCAKINKVYKHFGVYVGTKNLFGQGEDKDIFHRTRMYYLSWNYMRSTVISPETHAF